MSQAVIDSGSALKRLEKNRAVLTYDKHHGRLDMPATALAADQNAMDITDRAMTSLSYTRKRAHVRHRRSAAIPGGYAHAGRKNASTSWTSDYETFSVAKSNNQHGHSHLRRSHDMHDSSTWNYGPVVSGKIHHPYRVLVSVDDEPTLTIPNLMDDVTDNGDDDFIIDYPSILLNSHVESRDACRNHSMAVSMVQELRVRSHEQSHGEDTFVHGVAEISSHFESDCKQPLHG